ncbi:MAG: trigger factor [Candidatus Auribacterota bacterium]
MSWVQIPSLAPFFYMDAVRYSNQSDGEVVVVNVTVDKIGPCKHRLNIEVPVEDIKKEYESIVGEFVKHAEISGFRKGKVPRKMVESRFKDDIIEEMHKRLISSSYQESIKKHNLRPVHTPKIDNVKFDLNAPLTYTAELEVEPSFALKDYDGIKIKVKKVSVGDDEKDQYVESLRDAHATLENIEDRELLIGDYAIIDYKLQNEEEQEIEKGTSKLIFLDKNQGFLSGVIEKMEGMSIGDSRTMDMTLPDTYYKKEFAGKNVTIDMTLHEIKQKLLPEVDDNFAKNLGKFDNINELMAEIEKVLLEQKKSQQRADGKQQISDYLIDKHSFDLPESVVANETDHVMREFAQSQQKTENIDAKKLQKEARQEAEKRVKVAYILADIAEKEKIKVDKREIDVQIARMAASFNINAEHLKSQLIENGGIYGLQERILQDKVLDFLFDKAKVTEK